MPQTVTLLLAAEPRFDWRTAVDARTKIIRARDITDVREAVSAGRYRSEPLERVIIEAGAALSDFLALVEAAPEEFEGDLMFVETSQRALLSGAAPGKPRGMFELDGDDLQFYAHAHELDGQVLPQPLTEQPSEHRMRVLIAEDEVKTREMVIEMLNSLGCETLVARTGFEAIRIAEEQRPNVIVLDGLLPEMHGFEVARFIRNLSGDYRPRIVILTAIYKNQRYQSEARKYGVDQYLVKPAKRNELANAIFADASRDRMAS